MSLRRQLTFACLVVASLALFSLVPAYVHAIGSPDPQQSGSVGLQGKISAPPPQEAPTITTPSNGQTFNSSPITVSGLCKSGLMVKVFDNNVFVGAVQCSGGSYSLKASLFSGKNDLVAKLFDDLDQSGPSSNMVSVTYIDAHFIKFGTQLTLTSKYARIGANPGTTLTWPVLLSGGSGPYALSVDWGDSSGSDLMTREFAGQIKLTHKYKSPGIYTVIVKATDKDGGAAYLQLVGVANGKPTGNTAGSGQGGGPTIITRGVQLQWYFFIPVLLLLILAFWLGGRNELYVIRRRLERSRSMG